MIVRDDCFKWVPRNLDPGTIPLIITDPPYGGIIDEQWDKEWSIADQWRLTDLLLFALAPGGTAYVWGGIGKPGNRIFFEWLSKLERLDLVVWDVITWKKKRAYGTKNRLLFTREECAMIVKGDEGPKTFNIPLLDTKRPYKGWNSKYPAKSEFYRRSNVWDDVSDMMRGKIHKAEKPSRLAEIMIEISSNPGDLVLDMFAGSGSTGVAANKLGRECILVEKSDCQMHDMTAQPPPPALTSAEDRTIPLFPDLTDG